MTPGSGKDFTVDNGATAKWRTRAGTLGGLVLLVAGAGFAGPVSRVEAQAESRSLVAGSSAQGIRVTYTVPDLFVVTEFIDGGGPVAQANLDTTGRAVGFASLPYPGENAVTAPGLLSFLSGAPVPAYPFYARADHPVTPNAEVKDPSGTYVLTATAGPGRAASSADVAFGGVDEPLSHSTADSAGAVDAGGAAISAVAVTEGLSFGDGLLRIASVTSRSVSTYSAGSVGPETTAELIVEGARVGGQAVTIGPDGVHPLGQTVPVPIGPGAESLNQTLARAGVTVRTISGRVVDSGAASETLEVTVQHPVPGAGEVQGTLVYQIGSSSSFIALGPDSGTGVSIDSPGIGSGAPGGAPAPGPTGPSLPPSPPPDLGNSSGPAGLPSPGAPLGDRAGGARYRPGPAAPTSAGSASPSGAAGTPVPTMTAAPSPGETPAEAALVREFRSTARPLYGILAIGGALLLASSALWRGKGVQASWAP